MDRRKFMQLAGVGALGALSTGSVSAQQIQTDTDGFQDAPTLLGDAADRPDPGDPFFNDKIRYGYLYETPDGARYFITDSDDGWTWLPISVPEADIGDATTLRESDAGTTILENTDGNVVNVQLKPSGRAYLNANTTETVIDTQNEWYRIEGDWNDAHLNAITHDGAGGLTYTGDVTTQVQYSFGGTYESPNNNAEYDIAVFKNGTLKDRTVLTFSPPFKDERLALPGVFGFTDTTTTDMTHDIRVRCTSGTTNITFSAANFVLKG